MRYILIAILMSPLVTIGILFDIIKLPAILFFIIPLGLLIDTISFIKNGTFNMTIGFEKDLFFMGIILAFGLIE